jgi:hypothetical protein
MPSRGAVAVLVFGVGVLTLLALLLFALLLCALLAFEELDLPPPDEEDFEGAEERRGAEELERAEPTAAMESLLGVFVTQQVSAPRGRPYLGRHPWGDHGRAGGRWEQVGAVGVMAATACSQPPDLRPKSES